MREYELLVETMKNMNNELDIDQSNARKRFIYKKIKKGEHLLLQGQIENKLSFVCEGLIRYYYVTVDGHDITKHFGMKGDFVSSYASLIYRRPSEYYIVAEEESVVLEIDYETYFHAINNDKAWERIARLYTESIYNFKEIREASLLTMDGKSRYLDFLRKYPEIEDRVKQKHIATFLGLNPVSLSRIKSSLK